MSVQPGDTITGVDYLHVESCPNCGCVHAIPQAIYETGQRLKGARTIYCPNGHSWHYTGKTHAEEVRELKDRLAAARAERDQAETDAKTARAREGKERKARERLQKRAAAGVCPCCHRSFKQLRAHMRTKHPDFAETVR